MAMPEFKNHSPQEKIRSWIVRYEPLWGPPNTWSFFQTKKMCGRWSWLPDSPIKWHWTWFIWHFCFFKNWIAMTLQTGGIWGLLISGCFTRQNCWWPFGSCKSHQALVYCCFRLGSWHVWIKGIYVGMRPNHQLKHQSPRPRWPRVFRNGGLLGNLGSCSWDRSKKQPIQNFKIPLFRQKK